MTQIPGVTCATRRALKAIVDKNNVPFSLAVVALVVDDGDVVSALRDYLGYWRRKRSFQEMGWRVLAGQTELPSFTLHR